jgi:hypothetical protein
MARAQEDKPNQRRLTPEERLQRQRSNAGNRDEVHTEGTVVRVDCGARPPLIFIGNVDGEVRVELRGAAQSDCPGVGSGQNLEATGEKLDEHNFVADEIDYD